jgi:hypothetical protein
MPLSRTFPHEHNDPGSKIHAESKGRAELVRR